jgi:hypothetical protein
MDPLSFIAELVKALAWPGAVVLLVTMLRKPLSDLIPLLQRLKYKDLELEFGKVIEEVKEEVQAQLPPVPATKALTTGASAVLVKLAEMSPRAAIIEAWREVEDSLLDAAKRKGLDLPPRQVTLPVYVIRLMHAKGLVDSDKLTIVNDLRMLRNSAAHAPDFALSKDSALEYAELATRLTEYFRSL